MPCKVAFNKTLNRVIGECHIQKFFSSADDYACSWYINEEEVDKRSVRFHTKPFIEENRVYKSGTCHLNTAPSLGTSNYTVDIYPGTPKYVGTLKFAVHVEQCPETVPKNEVYSCMCEISKIGSPTGHLEWLDENGTCYYHYYYYCYYYYCYNHYWYYHYYWYYYYYYYYYYYCFYYYYGYYYYYYYYHYYHYCFCYYCYYHYYYYYCYYYYCCYYYYYCYYHCYCYYNYYHCYYYFCYNYSK
nr:hypothetical protein BaRGS_031074 [Batillaria attramentaria]